MGDFVGHPFRGNQWTAGNATAGAFSQAPLDRKGSKAWVRANQALYDSDPTFRTVVDAVTQFTQGDYALIYAHSSQASGNGMPEQWADSAVPGWADKPMHTNAMGEYKTPFQNQDLRREGRATWKESAAALNQAIADSKPLDGPMYRGMYGREAFKAFEQLKPGDELKIPGATSFTTSTEVLERFSSGGADRKPIGDASQEVQIIVAPGARALRAAGLSPYPQSEVISRGNFRVKSVRKEMVQRWVVRGGRRYQVERVVVELEQENV